MKVFSIHKWLDWDEKDKAVKDYQAYIASIRSQLPEDLQALAGAGGNISLNDGTIELITLSVKDATVEIKLHGKWVQNAVVGLRLIRLNYSGVTKVSSFEGSSVASDAGDFHSGGYGDHGFDEFEIIDSNLFEHRMLFSSGIEWSIRFSGFSLAYQDIPNGQHYPIMD